MNLDRRSFLQLSAATGAVVATRSFAAAAPGAAQAASSGAPRKLDILILGGTGFLGPALVTACEARGHKLTLFNRNKHNTDLFPHVERLKGDRDPNKDEGLKALQGERKWDVVFDDCGYYPRMVKASAELLGPRVKTYVYVSSISCYAKTDVEGMDEDAPCAVLSDPTVETMGEGYANYGGLKALCEQAAEAACPKRTCVIRPGYIVGPTDFSDRFTYWPARFDKGGEVLVPGAPTDPIQIIDVRDLAEWMVLVGENGTVGRFNACGPEKKLEWGKVIEACGKATGNKAKARWASLEALEKFPDVREKFSSQAIWAPYAGETKGFHTVSNARAVKAGMKFRSIDTITADTLKWFKEQPAERQQKLFQHPGHVTAARESEVIQALA